MKIQISKRDILWNYIGSFLSLGINFLMLPVLMLFLTGEMLGLWQVFLSIGSIALLLDFGLSPTLARNVAYVWSGAESLKETGVTQTVRNEPNYLLLDKVICVCKRVYLIIAVIAGTLLLTGGMFYIDWVSRDIASNDRIIAWLIYVLAIFLNLYFYYYSSALVGVGAVGDNNKAKVLACMLQFACCFLLSVLGTGIYAPAIAYLLYGLSYRLFAKYFLYKKIGKDKLQGSAKHKTDELKQIFSAIWHNAWRDGLVAVANYLIGQANTIICSVFCDLTETGIYSLSLQFVTAIGIIASVLYSSYQPRLQSAYINQDAKTCTKLMSVSVVVYDFVFILGIACLIVIGIPILRFINPEYVFDIPMLLGLGVYMYFQKRYSLFTSYISNTNRIPYVKAFVFSGVLSVGLSVVFIACFPIGIWGLILGQFVAQCVYNNWYWPITVQKDLGMNSKTIFQNCRSYLHEIKSSRGV